MAQGERAAARWWLREGAAMKAAFLREKERELLEEALYDASAEDAPEIAWGGARKGGYSTTTEIFQGVLVHTTDIPWEIGSSQVTAAFAAALY